MDKLINHYSLEALKSFFKKKASNFKPVTDNFDYILQESDSHHFSDLQKTGEIQFSNGEDLLVFACKTDKTLTERSSKKRQFEIAKKVLKEDFKDGAIFVFYDATGNFRFSFLRKNYGNKEQKFTTWKRFTYYVEKDKTNKTFKDRVGNGDFSSLDAIQKAFSVEKLTEDFYKELFAWYQWTLSQEIGITFPNNTEIVEDDRVKLEEQVIRLITRLLFVWFIKQKNLIPANLFDTDKLKEFLTDFDPNSKEDGNYYNAILQNLFFATLNKAIKERGFAQTVNERDIKTLYRYTEMFSISEAEILALFNEVPFLNGGLFECLDKAKSLDGVKYALDGFSRNNKKTNNHFKHRAFIPNCVFFDENKGIIPLLERYNFTVEENAPNEIQVALDPELLGNVFENLLGAFNPETKETARKQSGSFYTPPEIVSYMVDESLIFYLLNAFPNLKEDSIRELFTAEELPNDFVQNHLLSREISVKLKEIKIFDPACGSGAFPMGILNRMVEVLEKLACHKEKSVYDLKLHLIEECIYGVDIQTIAVQISKLRFFISLIVEQEEIDLAKPDENYNVITLPNLETKFVSANTLIGLASANKNLLNLNDKVLEEMKTQLWDIRKQHFYAKSANNKKKLRLEDENLRDRIKDYISANASKPNTAFVKQLETEISQLEYKRKNFEGELWVDETTKHTQVSMFDSPAKGPSIFKVDKNEQERKKIDTSIKALQGEIAKEKNKAFNIGFEKEIETIAKWNPYDQNTSSLFFDVEWMFGLKNESADAGCFDVVIGNPPYINVEKLNKAIKEYLFRNYETCKGRTDIYVAFIENSLNLLTINGTFSFIIPYSFTNQNYGSLSRKYLVNNHHIREILDTSEYYVFESAVVKNVILTVSNAQSVKETIIKHAKSNDDFKNHLFTQFSLKQELFLELKNYRFETKNIEKPLSLKPKLLRNSLRLDEICLVAYGARLNHRSKDIRKDYFIHSERNEGFKPFVEGKNIERFGFKQFGWLNYAPQEHYNPMFPELFENNKIIFINVVKDKLRFAYDDKSFYNSHTVINCVKWDLLKNAEHTTPKRNINEKRILNSERIDYKFLLSILNSNLINWYFVSFLSESLHFYPDDAKELPIFNANPYEQLKFSSLVDQIHSLKKEDKDTTLLEKQIDNLVYKLYDLTHEEVLIIDPEFSLSQSVYDNLKIEA